MITLGDRKKINKESIKESIKELDRRIRYDLIPLLIISGIATLSFIFTGHLMSGIIMVIPMVLIFREIVDKKMRMYRLINGGK